MILDLIKRAFRSRRYESVKQFEEEIWKIRYKLTPEKKVAFTYKGLTMFPIEESYILYYDICKILADTPYRFDWFYHLSLLLMYANIIKGDPLGDKRYQAYFKRATYFCGLEHMRDDVSKLCKSTSNAGVLKKDVGKGVKMSEKGSSTFIAGMPFREKCT